MRKAHSQRGNNMNKGIAVSWGFEKLSLERANSLGLKPRVLSLCLSEVQEQPQLPAGTSSGPSDYWEDSYHTEPLLHVEGTHPGLCIYDLPLSLQTFERGLIFS